MPTSNVLSLYVERHRRVAECLGVAACLRAVTISGIQEREPTVRNPAHLRISRQSRKGCAAKARNPLRRQAEASAVEACAAVLFHPERNAGTALLPTHPGQLTPA